ncbi:MAG: dihydroorotate dehydrogenase electron transfer subunit [Clostridium sp.]|nr:dihydroorotate dehydrogenase electron transfer subunit [Clostridium sp.]
MALQEIARLLSNSLIAQGIYRAELDSPLVAAQAQPGQFVHVLCGEKTLRRPISICRVDDGRITLVYAVRGEGTAWLSQQAVGGTLDILGALGNGFGGLGDNKRLLVVGGGIGVPPLLDCALRCGAAVTDAVLGFRTAEQVILEDEFAAACQCVAIATEDGSRGTRGFVTTPMERLLEENRYDAVFACGPMPMLRAVAELAAKKTVPCRLSLEERMGCGVGACLVCSAKIKRAGTEDYLRVCKDGPVFNGEELCW